MKTSLIILSLALCSCTVVTDRYLITPSDTRTRYWRSAKGTVYSTTDENHSKLASEVITRIGQSAAGVITAKGVLP